MHQEGIHAIGLSQIKHKCKFKEKSTWTPHKNRDVALETYIKAVKEDSMKLSKKIHSKDNLTPDEREALKKLRNRTDLIIKPADKGSATVVMSKEAYLEEAHRQYYCPILVTTRNLRKTGRATTLKR